MDIDLLVHRKLRKSVVRINIPHGFGTGVFVCPGTILTCAHVVHTGLTSVYHGSNRIPIIEIEEVSPPTQLDLALIHVDYTDHPFVCLDDSRVNIGDDFIVFGFTDRCPQGEDLTFQYEGEIQIDEQNYFIKIKRGQVIPGCSGSPVLNLNTGYVSGIVKHSWNVESDFGGYAISSAAILTGIPKLREKQSNYHKFDMMADSDKRIVKLLREACNKKQPEERQSLLEEILQKLRIDDYEKVIENGIWYFEVAQKLRNIDPETIYEIIETFTKYGSSKDALVLLSCLKSSWVDLHAAETIKEVIKNPQKQRAISVNSKLSFVSQCYVERANSNYSGCWRLAKTSNVHGEDQTESLLDEIKEVLIDLFDANLSDMDAQTCLDAYLGDMEKRKSPIFVSIPGYIYDDSLGIIREQFPTLTLFFLDERIPVNGTIQLDNQTIIDLSDRYICFLEPPLEEKEDLNAFIKITSAGVLIKNIQ